MLLNYKNDVQSSSVKDDIRKALQSDCTANTGVKHPRKC